MSALGRFSPLATDVSKIAGTALLVNATLGIDGAIGKFASSITGGDIPTTQEQSKQTAGMTNSQIRNPNIAAPTF